MVDEARSNAVVAAVVVVVVVLAVVVDRCAESTRAKVRRAGDSSVRFGRVHSWTLGMLPGTGALFRVRKNRPKKDVTRSDGRDDEMGRKKDEYERLKREDWENGLWGENARRVERDERRRSRI